MADMKTLQAAIEAELDAQAQKLKDDQAQPTGDAVQVMNDILMPLLAAVRRGAEKSGWNAQADGTPTDPTIWVRFWREDEPFGEIMFYPQNNDYTGAGLARSFSKPGSSNSLPLAPLPLKSYDPDGALSIVKDLVSRALSDNSQ